MIVLGVHDGHNSSCALVRDGHVLAAAEEERFRRIKNFDARRHPGTMPTLAARACLELANISPGQVDLVALPFSRPAEDWARFRRQGRRSVQAAAGLGLLAASKGYRLAGARLMLRGLGISAPVTRVNHHTAHAMSALWGSGFGDCLVVTLDGKGDLLSGLCLEAPEHGPPRIVRELDQLDSPGIFYSVVTRLLGFRITEDEGKVTAMAAGGAPSEEIRRVYGEMIGHQGGEIRFRALRDHATLLDYLVLPTGQVTRHLARALAAAGVDREHSAQDLAHEAQQFLEEACTGLVERHTRGGPPRDLCLAGGVFANVRVNRVLARLPGVARTFVQPAMGDSGLALGACFHALAAQGVERPRATMAHMFLGPAWSAGQLRSALAQARVPHEQPADLPGEAAARLARGETVALFRGRMEFGPRALGHRSILCTAADASVSRRLGQRLGRHPVMPFAPLVLAEETERCLRGLEQDPLNAPFMTTSYEATPWMREACPGAVHLDGTVRAQVVDSGRTPFLHALLSRYHQLTGLPCLINTSFNRHREPIVCSPAHALRAFSAAGLDAMVMEDTLVTREAKLSR